MSDALNYDRDHDTLYRYGTFLYDEGTRCPWWRARRWWRLIIAHNVHHQIVTELRARGELRSPNMFTAPDDPHVAGR